MGIRVGSLEELEGLSDAPFAHKCTDGGVRERRMRTLVTGASGFVGAAIVRALTAAGHEPVAAVREHSNIHRLPKDVATATLDLEDLSSIERAVRDTRPDAIIHAAAYGAVHTERDALRMVSVNVRGTLALHAASVETGVKRFVHLATAFEYAPSAAALGEDAPLDPRGSYAATKAAAAVALMQLARERSPRSVVMRLFNQFGPGDAPARLAQQIVTGKREGTRVELTAGVQQRDFSYVHDTARRIVAIAELPEDLYPAGTTLNVASGRAISVMEFATAFAAALDAGDLLRFGQIPERADAPHDLVADVSRLTALFARAGQPQTLSLTPLVEAARACLENGAS